MSDHKKIKHYLFYIGLSLMFIMVAASIQMLFVYKSFQLKFIIVPGIVGIIFGALIALVVDLKKQLKYQSKLFTSLVDFSPDLTYIKNLNGSVEYISPSVKTFTGYEPDEFYQDPNLIDAIIDPRDKEVWKQCQKRRENTDEKTLEVRIICKNGDIIWIQHNHDTVKDDHGHVIGIRSTNHNITNRKKYEEKIQDLANYDTLTQLPNRRLLMKEINHNLEDAKLFSSEFSIMFVDLDRFKYINDTFGHTFGDLLLKQVSKRLKKVTNLKGSVSRFGGDEFVILFPKNSQKNLLKTYALEISKELNRVYIINDITVYIDATIGIARHPYDGDSAESLIKNADIAMYKAKNSKHSKFLFFCEEFSLQSSNFFAVEHSLHAALNSDEMQLFYQPQFDIQTLEIVGAEALARWIQKDGTVISPDIFIPVAEESGLILQLGEHIIDLCLKFHKTLLRQDINLKIAINISPFQLQVKEQYLKIIDQIKASKIPQKNIEIEVTENLFLEQSSEQIENLMLFADAGYTIAIDDFGTGFSSLSYLKTMPAHFLKIDKIFTTNMIKSQADKAIVESIIAMAHNFGMKVIAEGIETADELKLLSELGCDYGQGYLFAKPMPKEELLSLLRTQTIASVETNVEFHI